MEDIKPVGGRIVDIRDDAEHAVFNLFAGVGRHGSEQRKAFAGSIQVNLARPLLDGKNGSVRLNGHMGSIGHALEDLYDLEIRGWRKGALSRTRYPSAKQACRHGQDLQQKF